MSIRGYRLLNGLILLALWAGSAWAYPRLPERIPVHFDLSGQPDRWEARSLASWFFLPAMAVGLAVFLHLAAALSARRPELWNVPDKRRFLALDAARQAPIVARLQTFMAALGVIIAVLLGVIQAAVYQATTGQARGLPVFAITGIAVSLLILLVLGVRLNAAVRRMIRQAEGETEGPRA